MEENNIKVVTYLRVGSCINNDISRKENEMYRLIDSHKDDWDVIAQFEDLGCSGRKFEREGLSRLFETLDDVDMVVTISSDMIARDVLVYKDIYQKIESKKCSLYIRDVHRNNVPKKKSFNIDLFSKVACAYSWDIM